MKVVKTLFLSLLLCSFLDVSSQVQLKQKERKSKNSKQTGYNRWVKTHHFKGKYRYWSIGASLGATNYRGDLNRSNHLFTHSFSDTRLSVGLDLTWRYSSRFSFRTSLMYLKIAASDAENADPEGDLYSDLARYTRNLSFRNNMFEWKVDVIVDWFENRKSMRSRMKLTPYVTAGIALFYHTPLADYGGKTYNLRELGTEGQLLDGGSSYDAWGIAIPMGIGIRYKINPMLDIAFEISARATFTDFLDDVSGNYVEKSLLGTPDDIAVILSDRSIEGTLHPRNQEKGVNYEYKEHVYEGVNYTYKYTNSYTAGFKRGSANDDDWYLVTGIHLTYIFHPKVYAARYRG